MPPEADSPTTDDPVFRAHEGGKLAVAATKPLRDRDDLSLLYTPGVAAVSSAIAQQAELSFRYTWRRNTVAVISDGTAVLGLGDIGPLGALPVMEGKAILFKHFADVDAVPVCMESGSVDELVEAIARIAPTYGGINLEDISAPRCFEIEARLRARLDIPVFHADQQGTGERQGREQPHGPWCVIHVCSFVGAVGLEDASSTNDSSNRNRSRRPLNGVGTAAASGPGSGRIAPDHRPCDGSKSMTKRIEAP